ncbi:hypothetical protein [Marinobacterium stanieri]|uniref:hypothetical protein n=1 Tax=Marinobacterium stanieri TaxID=49186 RepID=UPI000255A0E0|nr:hypothetical protein [Marinobacterium stanieri]
MLWEKRRGYTVEEFALLMGDYDPIHVTTVNQAEVSDTFNQDGKPGCWETSKKWRELLLEAIKYREFADDDIHLVGSQPDDFDDTVLPPHEVTLDTHINSERTKINRAPLSRWMKDIRASLPYFLLSNGELFEQVETHIAAINDAKKYTEELKAESKAAGCDFLEVVHDHQTLPDDLKNIQSLLAGEHEHQSEELALALKAWLGVSKLWKHGRGIKTPKLDIADWLDEHADNLPDAARNPKYGRIPTIANWEKKGGNKKAT